NVGVVADISASVDWLKENGSKKVGMVGYCMGSALTIACSARRGMRAIVFRRLNDEFDKCDICYGTKVKEVYDEAKSLSELMDILIAFG
ncbi:hypothetical protein CUMW_172300, partial [Citrus unshiu]